MTPEEASSSKSMDQPDASLSAPVVGTTSNQGPAERRRRALLLVPCGTSMPDRKLVWGSRGAARSTQAGNDVTNGAPAEALRPVGNALLHISFCFVFYFVPHWLGRMALGMADSLFLPRFSLYFFFALYHSISTPP